MLNADQFRGATRLARHRLARLAHRVPVRQINFLMDAIVGFINIKQNKM
jgi:hypothetical protein